MSEGIFLLQGGGSPPSRERYPIPLLVGAGQGASFSPSQWLKSPPLLDVMSRTTKRVGQGALCKAA